MENKLENTLESTAIKEDAAGQHRVRDLDAARRSTTPNTCIQITMVQAMREHGTDKKGTLNGERRGHKDAN
jgi:hypothetical protein